MVRKVTKSKGAFTSEMAALKLIYMTTINFEKKMNKSIASWARYIKPAYDIIRRQDFLSMTHLQIVTFPPRG